MKQLGFHWTDFHEIRYSRNFKKSVKKSQVSLISEKNNGYFTWRPIYQHLAEFFSEWEIFWTKVVEKIRTHILCSVTFIRKSCLLWAVENFWHASYCHLWGVTTRRMRFACWITKARIQTHTRNTSTYCFSNATVVTRTRLNVTLYIHCLFRFLLWCITLMISDEQIMAHMKQWYLPPFRDNLSAPSSGVKQPKLKRR